MTNRRNNLQFIASGSQAMRRADRSAYRLRLAARWTMIHWPDYNGRCRSVITRKHNRAKSAARWRRPTWRNRWDSFCSKRIFRRIDRRFVNYRHFTCKRKINFSDRNGNDFWETRANIYCCEKKHADSYSSGKASAHLDPAFDINHRINYLWRETCFPATWTYRSRRVPFLRKLRLRATHKLRRASTATRLEWSSRANSFRLDCTARRSSHDRIRSVSTNHTDADLITFVPIDLSGVSRSPTRSTESARVVRLTDVAEYRQSISKRIEDGEKKKKWGLRE